MEELPTEPKPYTSEDEARVDSENIKDLKELGSYFLGQYGRGDLIEQHGGFLEHCGPFAIPVFENYLGMPPGPAKDELKAAIDSIISQFEASS